MGRTSPLPDQRRQPSLPIAERLRVRKHAYFMSAAGQGRRAEVEQRVLQHSQGVLNLPAWGRTH
eukprot:6924733-Pyramimonas_sp.AAC.1